MTWLVEDPLTIVFAGAALAAIVAVVTVLGGRGGTILALVGVAALMAALLLVERLVVTEKERVEGVLYDVAAALERNDADAVLANLSPSAAELRKEAARRLRQVTVREAKVGGLNIAVREKTDPPSARATFTGRLSFESPGESLPRSTVVLHFVINFAREGDRWLIADYEEVRR